MSEAMPELPDDPALLKEMIRELLASLHQQQGRIAELQQRLDVLLRRLYGKRSERLDPAQQFLFGQAEEAPPAPLTAAKPAPGKPRRGKPVRRPLPKDLPREKVIHELPLAERLCPCCHQERACIGEEVSEQFDYRPACLFILEHIRKKYACQHCCEHVAIAAKPPQPIDKGIPGPGLLAHVIVSKYADHLPLYRQQRILSRQGALFSRSTLGGWLSAAAALLKPIVELMKKRILQGKVINSDDTPVRVQQLKGKTKEGRFWIYIGDKDHPHTVYQYKPGRSQDDPKEFLKDFTGYLQVDAWSGLDILFSTGKIIEVGCWAHARRHFYDARESDPARAHQALGWIRELYAVEAKAKGLSAEERQKLRQAESKPILLKFKKWLDEQQPKVLPKSAMGKAIGYALGQWQALLVYLQDGDLGIDNNSSERGFRGVAVGRRNWLFLGSDEGGDTAAVLFSVIASCQQVGAEPFEYLREVLAELPKLGRKPKDEDLHWWLPDEWQKRKTAQKRGPPQESAGAKQTESEPAKTSDVSV
jgi:transposase